jgi:hypothetical protein
MNMYEATYPAQIHQSVLRAVRARRGGPATVSERVERTNSRNLTHSVDEKQA